MAFGSPLGNLKGFASSRPPLVVFTLCLAAFAITTLSLAYYVRYNDSMANPDVQLDWTTFLKHLSDLDLCITPNESLAQRAVNHSRLAEDVEDGYGNVSIAVTASMSLIHQFATFSHNVTTISGVLPLGGWSSLCFTDADSSLNVTLSLPQNISQPQDICVTFSGPRSLLPVAHSPPACTPTLRGAASVNARLDSRSRNADALGERADDDWCLAGAVMRLEYHLDPDINVMLTLRDRSLINLHLVHTSYFLFFMAMSLVCYALVKGKHKQKTVLVEKIPLDPYN